MKKHSCVMIFSRIVDPRGVLLVEDELLGADRSGPPADTERETHAHIALRLLEHGPRPRVLLLQGEFDLEA